EEPVTSTVSPLPSSPTSSKTPPPDRTVCPTRTAEPSRRSRHHPNPSRSHRSRLEPPSAPAQASYPEAWRRRTVTVQRLSLPPALDVRIRARPDSRRATGTRNGEQDT